ncbi:MAG: flagellar hook-basal body complex protein [Candidatus Brocadiia bacterium]|jgi:flagellar hook protein FlgE
MSSIGSSLTGLQADQTMLDVIGNNLANADTAGFKASSVTFSEEISQTLKQASAGSGNMGGTNPVQIGLGVNVGTVSRDFSQGALTETGNTLDLAMNGAGFLALSDGNGTVFTPSASFSLSSKDQIVDSQNGYELLDINNNPITIPYNVQVPAQPTSSLTLAGNLSDSVSVPTAEVLSTTTPFTTATGAATTSTDLSALSTTSTPYQSGDTIVISGADATGNALTPVDFTYGAANDGTTLGDLINKINTAYAGQATASLDAQGNLKLTADTAGAASLALTISAGTSTGVTDWTANALTVATTGAAGGTYEVTSDIYDSLGNSHTLTMTFTRSDQSDWNMTASLGDSAGTVTQAAVNGIRFNTDGSFSSVTGGSGAQQIAISYNTGAAPQTINLSLGSSGAFNGLTLFGGNSTASATNQNGYASGSLSSYSIGSDGTIKGVYSNGVTSNIAQIQTATFANPNGLTDLGSGCWGATANSGDPVFGAATSSSTGSLASGSTEASNVDTATQLSELIIAQNSYEINAKAMSVSDQVIQQLTQII